MGANGMKKQIVLKIEAEILLLIFGQLVLRVFQVAPGILNGLRDLRGGSRLPGITCRRFLASKEPQREHERASSLALSLLWNRPRRTMPGWIAPRPGSRDAGSSDPGDHRVSHSENNTGPQPAACRPVFALHVSACRRGKPALPDCAVAGVSRTSHNTSRLLFTLWYGCQPLCHQPDRLLAYKSTQIFVQPSDAL